MSEMVERVKVAIFEAIEKTAVDANCLALQNGRIFFDGDFDAATVARAAIEAMREPTLAMSLSGMAAIMNETKGAIPPEMFDRAYSSAIDAALKEKPE